MDCNENDLISLETNTGQHADSSSKTQLQMYFGYSFKFYEWWQYALYFSLHKNMHTNSLIGVCVLPTCLALSSLYVTLRQFFKIN